MSSAKTFMKQMKPLTKIISTIPSWIFGLLLVVCCILLFIYIRNIYHKGYREGIENQTQPDTIDKDTYIQGFLKKRTVCSHFGISPTKMEKFYQWLR